MPPPSLIELKCHNCGSQLSPEDISPQLAAARCNHCNALFALPTALASAPIPRPEIALPKGFQIHKTGTALRISRRWLNPVTWFLLFFAIIWNGFILVWHGIALSQGMWFMSLFGLIHTGVGVFLVYFVAAQFLNTTTIRSERGTVSIHHGPLPWKGNKSLSSGDIAQLYCTEKISRGKNGSSASYKVEAVLKNKRRETLVSNIPDSDHALFIEQQLEDTLGITDRPVAGEHGR